MIAELFYPKELKEIIAELRANNDLNEEAEYWLKRFFIQNSFLLLLFGGGLILITEKYTYWFLLLLIPFVMKIEGNKHINRKFMPFVRGRKEILIDAGAWISMVAIKLIFRDNDGNRYVAPHITDSLKKEERKKRGDKISCYISNRNPRLCFPAFPRLMKKYCLSKSVIRENEQ